MSLGKRFFALTYDAQMRRVEKAGLGTARHDLLRHAAGAVLEIGAGTGINLTHYTAAVTSLTVTEPEKPMFRRLEARARAERPDTMVLRAPAEDLPFEDGTFDVAVSTLVLCGVDDQPRALRELCRVLRPGGMLLFFEHVRSDDPALGRHQDRMNWLNRLVVHCDCNRPTLTTMAEAGFTVDASNTVLPKAPRFVRPAVVGTAAAPLEARSQAVHLSADAPSPGPVVSPAPGSPGRP